MTQLELRLDWRTHRVDECPHNTLVYDGVMFADSPEDAFPQVTCYHPTAPHCGGSFHFRRFLNGEVPFASGVVYVRGSYK